MKSDRIFLDNNSTTPVDPRVLKAMMPHFTDDFGNPSSKNVMGKMASQVINNARNYVAALIDADNRDICFTSGATEAINWSLRVMAETAPKDKRHIITTTIEHSAVLKTLEYIAERHGFEVTKVSPGPNGIVFVGDIESAIRPETLLVVVMHVNNEIGTIQPIKEIGILCRERGVYFMVDAAQSLGKIKCSVQENQIDILTASGHKIYAPKGIGFLYVNRERISDLKPMFYGGGQENGRRAGTENVPYIVALGEACRIAAESLEEEMVRVLNLRNRFIETLRKNLPEMIINGCLINRVPGNINVSFPEIDNDLLLTGVEPVTISKGAACNTMKNEPSHVLLSISNDKNILDTAIRVCIGRFNTREEIDLAATYIVDAVRLIKLSNSKIPQL